MKDPHLWRRSNNPYHIWVSEAMLQQTRVDTVIPTMSASTGFNCAADLAQALEARDCPKHGRFGLLFKSAKYAKSSPADNIDFCRKIS